MKKTDDRDSVELELSDTALGVLWDGPAGVVTALRLVAKVEQELRGYVGRRVFISREGQYPVELSEIAEADAIGLLNGLRQSFAISIDGTVCHDLFELDGGSQGAVILTPEAERDSFWAAVDRAVERSRTGGASVICPWESKRKEP